MEAVSQTLANAKTAILGSGGAPNNEEPPSGATGKGTVDSPYDQGNAPEKSADPSVVVPSGEPGGATSTTTPKPPPIMIEESSSTPGVITQPSPADPLASASTTHQGSGDPMSEPTPQQEKVISESRGRDETSQRTTSTMLSPTDAKSTGTAAKGGNFDAAKPGAGGEANRLRYERSVSPGQLDDGTHVRCSGDRGQTYSPGNKFSDKLKDKFHFGSKK